MKIVYVCACIKTTSPRISPLSCACPPAAGFLILIYESDSPAEARRRGHRSDKLKCHCFPPSVFHIRPSPHGYLYFNIYITYLTYLFTCTFHTNLHTTFIVLYKLHTYIHIYYSVISLSYSPSSPSRVYRAIVSGQCSPQADKTENFLSQQHTRTYASIGTIEKSRG